jgi:precorrin-3B synthase
VPQTSPITSRDTNRTASRDAADRCPGVLRLAQAADGYLARIRLPGGLVSAAQLRALARLAGDLGDGRAELTSRGNVQLRGLAADAGERLTGELTHAGLLPSLSHDRVRNILASPLAGLDDQAGGHSPDLTAIVRALDAALCARPRLAELSGRFLFAIDDGRGDVAGLGADVVATVLRDGAAVNGLAARKDSTVDVMLACAEAFLDLNHGGTAWRIADLPGGAKRVQEAVADRLGLAVVPTEPTAAQNTRPVGLVGNREEGAGGSAAVLLAPLGRLTGDQLTWLADRCGQRPARITPWRSVVLPDLADAAGTLRAAAGLGFGVDAASPWLRVTACAGRPGCVQALADVQADALSFAAQWPGRIVHVSGCGRHCGRPAATEIDVTATSEGYQVAPV